MLGFLVMDSKYKDQYGIMISCEGRTLTLATENEIITVAKTAVIPLDIVNNFQQLKELAVKKLEIKGA